MHNKFKRVGNFLIYLCTVYFFVSFYLLICLLFSYHISYHISYFSLFYLYIDLFKSGGKTSVKNIFQKQYLNCINLS